MSQRPPASRPASRSPPGGQRITLPSLQLRDDLQAGGRPVDRQQQEQPELRGFPPILPSPQHGRIPQAGTPGEDRRAAPPLRDLGVHSILNPTEPEGAQVTPASSRRVSSGTTESPLSAAGPPSQFAPSPTLGPHTFPGPLPFSDTSPTQEGHRPASFPRNQGRSPRRILTPKSRAPSLGRGGHGTATTFNARESPFIGSRGRTGYAAGSGQSEIPPMPTPPGHPQQHYGFPPENSASMAGRPSMPAPGRTPLSQSASPSMSSSTNPLSSQTSPASFLPRGPPPPGGGYFPGQSLQQLPGGGGMQFQAPSASGTEGPYSAPPPSALASTQSTGSARYTADPIHVMTYPAEHGLMTVQVDVQQASKLANEKRARNAGASARFRQRRKEKEKDASMEIEKLQQQARDLAGKVSQLEQERDFYRGERDRFRDVLYRAPETRDFAMRAPPSPQSMRGNSFSGPGSIGGPPPPMSFQPPPQESPVERPTRRRRTDTTGEFTNVPYSLPPASTLPPVNAPGYATPGPTNLPPIRTENPGSQQTSPTTTTPATTSGPPHPFEVRTPRYDTDRRGPYDRGWPSEGGRS